MEITTTRAADQTVVLRLVGRLDANWCKTVQDAITAAIRAGDHRLRLDLAAVAYISSAGLRVLLGAYKQLRAINGAFTLGPVSPEARTVIDLAGLSMLLVPDAAPAASDAGHAAKPAADTRAHSTASATFELYPISDDTAPLAVQTLGDPAGPAKPVSIFPLQKPLAFGPDVFAIGLGALGADPRDASARLGEFLAVAGAAVFQPTDGSPRPDFAVCEAGFVPAGHLPLGLRGEGKLPHLARFAVTKDAPAVPLSELATTALELSGGAAAFVVAYAETAGLVGATLRKPLEGAPADRFAFPQIRDWLSFTTERAHRDTTSLVVGVVARSDHALAPWLRPLAKGSDLLGHFHAAVFPYRPIRKGRLELPATVSELFENSAPQALLHLLADNREITGVGESEFHRGALWFAPLAS